MNVSPIKIALHVNMETYEIALVNIVCCDRYLLQFINPNKPSIPCATWVILIHLCSVLCPIFPSSPRPSWRESEKTHYSKHSFSYQQMAPSISFQTENSCWLLFITFPSSLVAVVIVILYQLWRQPLLPSQSWYGTVVLEQKKTQKKSHLLSHKLS